MRKHSTVLTHIFLHIHSKQRFRLTIYMYIRSLLSKTCSSGIVFGLNAATDAAQVAYLLNVTPAIPA